MKRFLFYLITLFDQLSFYDYSWIDCFSIALKVVNVLEFRKSFGSVVRWIVRLIAFAVISYLFFDYRYFRFSIKNRMTILFFVL